MSWYSLQAYSVLVFWRHSDVGNSSIRSYSEWLHGFEKKAKECIAGISSSEEVKLRGERERLEMELEKAEIERSTYVTEVRELKDLLTELQKKLDDSYSEAVRQNEELNLESSEKETMSVSLNQTIAQLQQLLLAVNKQLTKEK
ncbi:Kinectin [Fukomys damarensis]|uniref:Kinectin n=1 Tax=Fukomys damarensis TaxID=885580 RepID=A0A091EET3_FUKDA|nr:Kinectin [Fukomys damarensis]